MTTLKDRVDVLISDGHSDGGPMVWKLCSSLNAARAAVRVFSHSFFSAVQHAANADTAPSSRALSTKSGFSIRHDAPATNGPDHKG